MTFSFIIDLGGCLSPSGGGFDPVSPRGLSPIEGKVGLEHRPTRGSLQWRHPDRGGDRSRAGRTPDRREDPDRDLPSLVQLGPGEEQGELVAAEPGDEIMAA